MSQADFKLNTAVRDLILQYRPDDLPEDVSIVIATDIAKTPRPMLVCYCIGGEHLHPLVRKSNLVLRLRTRADEAEGSAASLWHATACATLNHYVAELYTLLLAQGLKLKRFTPGEYSQDEDDDRSHIYEQSFKVVMETVIP